MKLSARARYALRLIVEIDRLGGQRRPVRLPEVARTTRISKRYMEQLTMALKSHSLLRGVSGRNGGYVLARPAAEITIGEVLRAVIGPIELSVCVDEPSVCLRAEFCECRLIWLLLDREINRVLNTYTLADLSNHKLMQELRTGLFPQSTPQATIA